MASRRRTTLRVAIFFGLLLGLCLALTGGAGGSSGFIVITPTTLADGTVGQPYSQNLAGTGSTGNYTWGVTSGSLPAGLNLTYTTGNPASQTARISGTPTAAGNFNFT